MSKEKQISEMAYIVARTDDTCKASSIALALYNAGYCKQSEGEWKQAYNSYPRYVCTNCNRLFNNKTFKYCPNCGAHMRKEDEGK